MHMREKKRCVSKNGKFLSRVGRGDHDVFYVIMYFISIYLYSL